MKEYRFQLFRYVCVEILEGVEETSMKNCVLLDTRPIMWISQVEELLTMLRESECLDEQGDILQYLVDTQGLNYDTGKWMFQPSCNLTDNYIFVT